MINIYIKYANNSKKGFCLPINETSTLSKLFRKIHEKQEPSDPVLRQLSIAGNDNFTTDDLEFSLNNLSFHDKITVEVSTEDPLDDSYDLSIALDNTADDTKMEEDNFGEDQLQSISSDAPIETITVHIRNAENLDEKISIPIDQDKELSDLIWEIHHKNSAEFKAVPKSYEFNAKLLNVTQATRTLEDLDIQNNSTLLFYTTDPLNPEHDLSLAYLKSLGIIERENIETSINEETAWDKADLIPQHLTSLLQDDIEETIPKFQINIIDQSPDTREKFSLEIDQNQTLAGLIYKIFHKHRGWKAPAPDSLKQYWFKNHFLSEDEIRNESSLLDLGFVDGDTLTVSTVAPTEAKYNLSPHKVNLLKAEPIPFESLKPIHDLIAMYAGVAIVETICKSTTVYKNYWQERLSETPDLVKFLFSMNFSQATIILRQLEKYEESLFAIESKKVYSDVGFQSAADINFIFRKIQEPLKARLKELQAFLTYIKHNPNYYLSQAVSKKDNLELALMLHSGKYDLESALINSCRNNNVEAVEMLLLHGAKLSDTYHNRSLLSSVKVKSLKELLIDRFPGFFVSVPLTGEIKNTPQKQRVTQVEKKNRFPEFFPQDLVSDHLSVEAKVRKLALRNSKGPLTHKEICDLHTLIISYHIQEITQVREWQLTLEEPTLEKRKKLYIQLNQFFHDHCKDFPIYVRIIRNSINLYNISLHELYQLFEKAKQMNFSDNGDIRELKDNDLEMLSNQTTEIKSVSHSSSGSDQKRSSIQENNADSGLEQPLFKSRSQIKPIKKTKQDKHSQKRQTVKNRDINFFGGLEHTEEKLLKLSNQLVKGREKNREQKCELTRKCASIVISSIESLIPDESSPPTSPESPLDLDIPQALGSLPDTVEILDPEQTSFSALILDSKMLDSKLDLQNKSKKLNEQRADKKHKRHSNAYFKNMEKNLSSCTMYKPNEKLEQDDFNYQLELLREQMEHEFSLLGIPKLPESKTSEPINSQDFVASASTISSDNFTTSEPINSEDVMASESISFQDSMVSESLSSTPPSLLTQSPRSMSSLSFWPAISRPPTPPLSQTQQIPQGQLLEPTSPEASVLLSSSASNSFSETTPSLQPSRKDRF